MMFVRKDNRLPHQQLYNGGYWYFVTICVQDKTSIFGQVNNDKMILNKVGQIMDMSIAELKNHYEIIIEDYTIMPNHVHLLIGALDKPLSTVIAGLKSFSRKRIYSFVAEGSRLPFEANQDIVSYKVRRNNWDKGNNSEYGTNFDYHKYEQECENGEQKLSATVNIFILWVISNLVLQIHIYF
jgi:REP element-mobilizing transposase RayT